MKKTEKKHWIGLGIFYLVFAGFVQTGLAANNWIYPIFSLEQEFDDNIYLTKTDKTADSLTTIFAGLGIEPKLSRHEFMATYIADLNYFAKNTSQNTQNHNFTTSGTLNFNQWRVEADNLFRYFEDREGSEDTARIPRTKNSTDVKIIYAFNKLDLGLKYAYELEDYRSDAAIGAYNGQALTYQDLDTNEHSGEVEMAFKFWPKTSLLFSGVYGTLKHDTGKKSDSDYFDILTGLRGQFMSKGTIEGKVGYRSQNYENAAEDFSSIIFQASLIEKLSSKDTMTMKFVRTTNSTIYQQNAFYTSTTFSGIFAHVFSNRITGLVNGSYDHNQYDTETTEGLTTDKRADDLLKAGLALKYQLPRWGTVNFAYTYSQKISNFDTYDYNNNLVTLGMEIEF